MNDLLNGHQEVLVAKLFERQTGKVEIFSKICKDLIASESDAVVPVQGVDLWRFCHGDCETSAGKFYTNFSSLARNSITNRKFHIPICSGTISALVDKELRWRNGEMQAVFCFISSLRLGSYNLHI